MKTKKGRTKSKSEKSLLSPNIYLEKSFSSDFQVLNVVEKLNTEIKFLEDSSETMALKKNDVYITQLFEQLAVKRPGFKILGRPALLELAVNPSNLYRGYRHRYCNSLVGAIVSITGIQRKEEMAHLLCLIRWMGGRFRENINHKTTFLVSGYACSAKSQYAYLHEIPVVHSSWLYEAWERRNELDFSATNLSFISKHKLKPFHGAKIGFIGFTEEEKLHLNDVLIQNGGTPVNENNTECTHLVVNESFENSDLTTKNNTEIVKESWFWTSVQYQSCGFVKDYCINNISMISSSTLEIPYYTRKRKKQLDNISNLTAKIHKSISNENISSIYKPDVIQQFPMLTNNYDNPKLSCRILISNPNTSTYTKSEGKNLSPRYQIFTELLQTETNYVGILNTIISLYKIPLETMVEKEEYLNNTEIKIIFGDILPIYEVHSDMLKKIKQLAKTWEENSCIGNIIIEFSKDLLRAYPPYINYFEKKREMLLHCDQTKPRFHAFLKVGQTRPECCRESLQELLIRPVQRLPSISLLLNDILKHTDKINPDHKALKLALESIREVMTFINEDKRKTEGQVALFDIFNEIDNCPAHLVSSSRNFIARYDVIELSENITGRGDHLTIFLFSDTLEFTKKRRSLDVKSPKEFNSGFNKGNITKLYKHIKLISLNSIKQVIDVKETDGFQNVFSLLIIENQDFQECLCTFAFIESSNYDLNYKNLVLNSISQQVAITNCSRNVLISLDSNQLDINTNKISTGTLEKAFRFANKTRLKFSRALSFNKNSNVFKEIISSMVSPAQNLKKNESSLETLTPSTQLSKIHLTSCSHETSLNLLNESKDNYNSFNKNKTLIKHNSKLHKIY
ncbi:protein ECT2-like isoform X3 [Daktulosphaira vitifoliae]|uniref:protein ECT2-like isoform X3 n=1 Tax=Daktulosphaira vitifoliae TaxID=58002 RepID=UPI0021AAB184|nr:protein ECT2-like isoform X3 [Daktulosphaira vitifoliae]